MTFKYINLTTRYWAPQVVLVGKNLPASAGDVRRGFSPWIRRIPWRRAWQPTPVFLPGESHGQRSLSIGQKELDTAELTEHACTHTLLIREILLSLNLKTN